MGISCGKIEPSPMTMALSQDELKRIRDLKTRDFNIECLAFEGGGAKAAAYVGAAMALDELGVLSNVKRFAGTSAGALVAVLLAIRLPLDEIRHFLDSQKEEWIRDACGGCLSLLPNVIKKYGWNPAKRIEDVLRSTINKVFTSELNFKKEKTGQSNVFVTFMDVYKKFNTELCILSTNLSTKKEQYHHPKTTPNQSIVEAFMASMAIPVFCQPVVYNSQYLVDGGLLVNFPVHAFDGWYLSMELEDSFFHKSIRSRDAFSGFNEKTVGFIVTSMWETCPISDMIGVSQMTVSDMKSFPDTKLKGKREDELTQHIQAMELELRIEKAVKHFWETLQNAKLSDEQGISKENFLQAYNKKPLTTEDADLLFGKGSTADSIFKDLDKTPDDMLTYSEFMFAILEKIAQLRSRLKSNLHDKDSKITSITQFLGTLFETVHGFTQMANFTAEDVKRTVNIETCYVNTLDLDLEPEDMNFLVHQGVNACLTYMEKRSGTSPTQ